MIQHQNTSSASLRKLHNLPALFGRWLAATRVMILMGVVSTLFAQGAQALELDWSGQFRAEYNFIHNYSADNTDAAGAYDATRVAGGGYYIPSGGSSDASFQTLFLRVRPKIVVNDNIYIKSEWWVGDPVFGIFGNAVPFSVDQKQFYSNQSRGSMITAQRFWAEFLSDVGTVQIGRAPLNWGLGLVWNSGEGLWDRYQSTGDTLRLISKFGAFSFAPSFVLYSTGNSVGGSCAVSAATGLCTPGLGGGGVREYTLALKYENPDEDFEGGLNFVKRLGDSNQDAYTGTQGTPIGMNFNIWDIYARKRFGKFTLAAEVPVVTGSLGTGTGQGLDYSTFAVATEVSWKINDTWEVQFRGGHAPGQPNFGGTTPDNFRAFFFNPAYRLGNIMFNYQLAGFAGPNTQNNPATGAQSLVSPYDNPIVNANYLTLAGLLHTDKWTFNAGVIYAQADQTAAAGQRFYNYVSRSVSPVAIADQGNGLGVETDLGAAFQWDEYFTFRLDAGLWLPGSYYKFSNTAVENTTSPVYSGSARVGIVF